MVRKRPPDKSLEEIEAQQLAEQIANGIARRLNSMSLEDKTPYFRQLVLELLIAELGQRV